ncbi:MBOAT family O-acyltransferase [Inediibacterium massiliense]|uniref:MBOAT family O-acyltransferase n=1 Tax=Inediibacterium massiliense TaxID=1658111 RepID=UPI0006B49E4A|nr:MBOAT family O-acyltransferase [Inediibacterium massiliense]
MVFSSLIFIFLFLPFMIFIYYLSPRFLRNLVLLLGSLAFYAWGEPIYILIMIFSTVFDYVNGLLIEKYKNKKRVAKSILFLSMVVNLGILCFFKYYGFIITNINGIFHMSMTNIDLPLPVGISFYTFQTMSYVIDVYRGEVCAQKNIISFGTYVAMFPQLVAGPIVKYKDISKELSYRKENIKLFGEGVQLFIIGLSKKVLLANNIGLLWDSIKGLPSHEISIVSAWTGIIAFTFQIYFDFSGYSDMAIGLGKIFGFHFTKNFNYPYISKSVTEFWRRWHISLGTWFREYVYIPLGGNRLSSIKQYRNLLIVWFLTGLWHGANWNFILWGIYFGIFVTIEKLFLLKWLENRSAWIRHIYTMIVVMIGWVFFEFESMISAVDFIETMFGWNSSLWIDSKGIYDLYTNILLFVILFICSTPVPKNMIHKWRQKYSVGKDILLSFTTMILLLICTAYLVNESYNPFLYFRF